MSAQGFILRIQSIYYEKATKIQLRLHWNSYSATGNRQEKGGKDNSLIKIPVGALYQFSHVCAKLIF